MTSDALAVLECLFSTLWALFTSWNIPGTSVSPAEMFLFLIAAGIGLRFALSFLTGNRASVSGAVQDQRYTDQSRLQNRLQEMDIRSKNSK